MHEYGLMEAVLAQAAEEMDRLGSFEVEALRIQVGRLAAASPEALVTAFLALAAGTRFEDAALELEDAPGRLRCESCRAEGLPDEIGLEEPEDHGPWLCPRCGYLLRDLEGTGLRLLQIRFRVQDDPNIEVVEGAQRRR